MPDTASQNTLTNKKRLYTILAVAAKIALLTTLCITLSPNPIWGPRILKSSPVDISLIERLDGYAEFFGQKEMEAWMEAVDKSEGILEELDHRPRWSDPNVEGSLGSYIFGRGIPFSRVYDDDGSYYSSWGRFTLRVYDSVENANERIRWEREEGFRSDIRGQYLTVSDNVEATLRSVFWNRSSYPPFPYVSHEKILETRIRVGNVIIDASEISDDLDRMGTSTNLALKQIVEALESLELEKD